MNIQLMASFQCQTMFRGSLHMPTDPFTGLVNKLKEATRYWRYSNRL